MISNIKKYVMSPDDSVEFHRGFSKILTDVSLASLSKDQINKAISDTYTHFDGQLTGVYFWIMRLGEIEHKIYIGKTKSLERRLSDYTNGFQIHSPNDYKLQFFQVFTSKHYPDAKFDLYFWLGDLANYTAKETESIRKYKALINEPAKPNKNVKGKMRDAFYEYYEGVFLSKLNA